MSESNVVLSLYYVMLVALGSAWLVVVSRGVFFGEHFWDAITLGGVVLAVHILVVTGYVQTWPLRDVALVSHVLVALPMGAALFASVFQRMPRLRAMLLVFGALVVLPAAALVPIGVLGLILAGTFVVMASSAAFGVESWR